MSTTKQRASQDHFPKLAARSLSGQVTSQLPGSSRRASQDNTGRKQGQDPHIIIPDARWATWAAAKGDRIAISSCMWETSVGNIEEARVTFDVIARAVEDAVYLDEEAYREIAPTMQFTKVIRAQQRKIEHLEVELRETRAKLEESNAIQSEALQRHAEMQQEIENNAVVFQMHYQELMSKDDEIRKLTAVIQALSGR